MEKYGVGAKHITNEGYEIEVVEKLENDKRRVIFEDGYEVIVFIHHIKTGKIKNPYHPSVCGVGYFGVGEYKAKIDGKPTPEYGTWNNMIQRCYDKKYQENHPTYKGTIVCEEWLNFQNFSKWYEDNYPKIEGVNFDLDKDLLQEGVENKVYSPETCVFLPKSVNLFLSHKYSNNTSGFVGVYWDIANKKWRAQINLFGEGKRKNLGLFTTPEEASLVYQKAREIEAEKVKSYLRGLDYLPEHIIQLVK